MFKTLCYTRFLWLARAGQDYQTFISFQQKDPNPEPDNVLMKAFRQWRPFAESAMWYGVRFQESKKSKVKNSQYGTLFRLFRLFRRREAPGTHFRLFFGLWARRAQMTPVAGEEDRNSGFNGRILFKEPNIHVLTAPRQISWCTENY